MKKVYLFLADGFEEVEAITPIDVLRRGGVDLNVVSVGQDLNVVGGHGLNVIADVRLLDCDFSDADMLVLPGGTKGVENLSRCKELLDLVVDFNSKNKWIAAICAAPSILGKLGVLDGRNAVCYPGGEKALLGATIGQGSVVLDGNIITSKGPGTAFEFSSKIVEVLIGAERSNDLREKMLY